MGAPSRSVTAIRETDEGNHRITIPHATRPGQGRERDDDERRFCRVGGAACYRSAPSHQTVQAVFPHTAFRIFFSRFAYTARPVVAWFIA
jgi:hypothetical protein